MNPFYYIFGWRKCKTLPIEGQQTEENWFSVIGGMVCIIIIAWVLLIVKLLLS